MHAILVGGGVAGLSAAVSLAARGHQITVLEQAEGFAETGAGLQLSPNATRVLTRWGLAEDLARIAFEPEALEVRDHVGRRLLLRTELGPAARRRWRAPYLQVHRADLHGLLATKARAQGGTELRLGARVSGIGQDDAGVLARLADGTLVRGDVLIGCDGIRSVVQQTLHGRMRARFTGHVAWRGVAPAARLSPGLVPPIAAVWTGRRRHFVHYYVCGGDLVNFLGVVQQRGWKSESWTERGDPAELAAAFADWPQPVPALIDCARETWRWGLFDRKPLPRWSVGRVSLLGDAAHPMTPFLAQGAAMAIEDAATLAEALAAGRGVEAGLLAYEAARRPRTARVQAWSRRNGRLFHLPGPVSGLVFAAGSAAAARQLDWLYGYGA